MRTDLLPAVWLDECGTYRFNRDGLVYDLLATLSEQSRAEGWTDEELDAAVCEVLGGIYRQALH